MKTFAILTDVTKCIGCRYCMMSCPYGTPQYSWQDRVSYIRKCNLCYPRVKDGAIPYCVEACPTQATIFGDREELLAEARRRLKAEPDKYIQKVWGETEVGGTCVMYVSDVDVGLLARGGGVGDAPLPRMTWVILNKMPATKAEDEEARETKSEKS